ncbi:zinc-ribbon domain-containing protein [Tateyamaria armeniaca]|uniref:Zinc-ribbon domain-containing protein n=1 Tax=Tateyamaria armeniaca TaxID=2518930 RepID=A0ABW8UP30_9RHOB
MRLICPNCDAQYEVVDDVIPTEGRDVQCSNCGQTWFQHHPDHMPEASEEVDEPADLGEPDDAPGEDEERVATTPQRKELDTSVADILRQEAELEAKARAGDALESQPELGLQDGESDAERRNREAQERMAKIRGEETPERAVSEAAATAAALGSRRDLLPDIEEINSTLRSSGDRQAGVSGPSSDAHAAPVAPPAKSGFRRGFSLMILLTVVLGAIYVMAPQIAQSIPQVDPYLSSYVAQVDTARAWLDGHVTSVLTWLDAVASSHEG